jgi:hypothetical protein
MPQRILPALLMSSINKHGDDVIVFGFYTPALDSGTMILVCAIVAPMHSFCPFTMAFDYAALRVFLFCLL